MNFIAHETKEKLRGAYYTPAPLTRFLAKYVLKNKHEKILEPSCGDGAFFEAIQTNCPDNNFSLTGIELNITEAGKASRKLKQTNINGKIIPDDFLDWYLKNIHLVGCFDAVIGNPPFIRYQYLSESKQLLTEKIFEQLNLKFTKHTNAWIPFVLASIELLKPSGRLGMVVPSEIFNVIYAQSLREYLGKTCSEITIIDPDDIWFDSTLQGAILLLAEKKKNSRDATKGLGIVRVHGFDFCEKNPEQFLKNINRINGHTIEGKWTAALLSDKEYSLLQEIKSSNYVKAFSNIADADVGIVTGANGFFLVDQKTVEKYDLQEFAHPMFGRSEHCPGILYTHDVHKKNIQEGLPSSFLWITKEKTLLTKKQRQYILLGEKEALHTRYKCRIRQPWYTVPSVYSTQIGMMKRSHDMPRLILNRAGAYTTDTAYRIRSDYISPDLFVFSFINSLTALSAEIEGRSYGGGVLELVPSEINNLLIPVPQITDFNLVELNKMVTSLHAEDYLPTQDKIILGNIGINRDEQAILFNAWRKLRDRRHRKQVSQSLI
jgi:adenine-specific DNA methylase